MVKGNSCDLADSRWLFVLTRSELEQAIKAACETAGAKTVEDGITTADEEINLIQEYVDSCGPRL